MVKKDPRSDLLNLYLSKFVEEIQNLYNHGILIKKNGIKILFKFCISSCVVDSVCRPILQNRVLFNGYSDVVGVTKKAPIYTQHMEEDIWLNKLALIEQLRATKKT